MTVMPSSFLLIPVVPALVMLAWGRRDARAEAAGWARLRTSGRSIPAVFAPTLVQDLPEAARRYFLFTIAPGTALRTTSEIRMRGEIGLGNQAAPRYMPMRARQILAPPHGFIWQLDAGSDAMRVSGSDGMVNERSWTRFWFNRLIPVVRVGGNANHLRASFGRVVAEAVFWAPASLLPGNGVEWVEDDRPGRARAIVTRGSLTQALEIEVADDGRPLSVVIPRWSNANPDKEWRVQPFGGTVGEFRNFGGFTLPTRVDGGNHFGTENFFPFFRAQVDDIAFLDPHVEADKLPIRKRNVFGG